MRTIAVAVALQDNLAADFGPLQLDPNLIPQIGDHIVFRQIGSSVVLSGIVRSRILDFGEIPLDGSPTPLRSAKIALEPAQP